MCPPMYGRTEHRTVATTELLSVANNLSPFNAERLIRRRAVSRLKIQIPSKKISAGSVVQRGLIPALKG
jgi:hypothetical protein